MYRDRPKNWSQWKNISFLGQCQINVDNLLVCFMLKCNLKTCEHFLSQSTTKKSIDSIVCNFMYFITSSQIWCDSWGELLLIVMFSNQNSIVFCEIILFFSFRSCCTNVRVLCANHIMRKFICALWPVSLYIVLVTSVPRKIILGWFISSLGNEQIR